ncbi:Crp/Fnr family transcriptional regulator [Kitasatospora sp. NPDC087315]|uniref:Crp/Fnr family transcriptional regulator n=1 Tax=Kitasatospora sp. NPDC087315 TaxID=3364069 RepID=UPI003822DB0D
MAVDELWQKLRELGPEKSYRSRDLMLSQGEAGTSVLLLTRGAVWVALRTVDGTSRFLGFRGPLTLLGEMSAFSGRARNADVMAVGPCRAVVLPTDRFLWFVKQQRDLVLDLLWREQERRHESELKCSELKALPLEVRLARSLLRLAEFTASLRVAGLTREELAQSVGVTRGALRPALAELRESGVLATRRQLIEIKKVEVLRSLACVCGGGAALRCDSHHNI